MTPDQSRPVTISEYIAAFPKETRLLLEMIRKTIGEAAPAATEAISYQIPTFKLMGNLVHFAGYKNHIGFYPGAAAIAAFREELSAFKNAKGSVQFPLNKPLPLELVTKIVMFCVKANHNKAEEKSLSQGKSQTNI